MNCAYEKQTGYVAKDIVGVEMQDTLQVDNCNEEQTLVYHMKKNQVCSVIVELSSLLYTVCNRPRENNFQVNKNIAIILIVSFN